MARIDDELDDLFGESESEEPGGQTNPEPEPEVKPEAAPLPGTVGDELDAALDMMRRRRSGAEVPVPLPWGSVSTALSGGLWPGFHVLVGATGTGKTAFAVQAAMAAACPAPGPHDPVPVLYVALELGPVDMTARCLAVMNRKPWSALYLGKIDPDEMHGGYLDRLRAAPLHLEVGPPHGWSYDTLHARVAAMRARYPSGPMLVVLDFLQLVSSPERAREDLRERIGRAAYACRAAARDHNVAVLALSSASRENAVKLGTPSKDTRDTLRDASLLVGMGKESGDVESSADSVLVLRKLEHRRSGDRTKGGTIVDVAVAKQRAGPGGFAESPLLFNGSWFDVHDESREAVVKRAEAAAKGGGAKPDEKPGSKPEEPDIADKYSKVWGDE
jgi:replicative DNA helicase